MQVQVYKCIPIVHAISLTHVRRLVVLHLVGSVRTMARKELTGLVLPVVLQTIWIVILDDSASFI